MMQNDVNISGMGVFRGDIEAETVRCSGMGKAHGAIVCRRLEVSGMFKATKPIKAEEVDIKGFVKSNSDISAERFHAKGAVSIDGLLNAGTIDIQSDRMGKIREIGAESVSIRPLGSVNRVVDNILNNFTSRQFKVDVIEANEIYLENVDVVTVRGENVVIGPNCHVRFLEYSKKAKVHDSARVIEMKGQKPSNF
ncbi:MAG: hypothetical protein N2376_05420 [Clostridia bacterium]|nr:hypothetical protein [Clostridia bacterium]